MVSLFTFAVIYISGGLTFLPALLLLAYWFASAEVYSSDKDPVSRYPKEQYHETDFESGKKGWIRLTNHAQSALGNGNGNKLMAGLQAVMNNNGKDVKRPKDLVYGVLKHGTLFLYESESQQECKMIVPVHDYTVSIFPEGVRDHELFNRSTAIRLKPKHARAQTMVDDPKKPQVQTMVKSKTDSELDVHAPDEGWALDKDIFLMCARPIDKEDWYLSLIYASGFMADDPFTHIETIDATRFDAHAMQDLIMNLQKDPDHRHVQWLNAILGRIFLGLYKTDRVQRLFQDKITKKAKKMKRPAFLDEIHVQTVKFGQNIPYLTQPKLLGLTMDGALEAEAQVDYAGGLCVVIETDFHWTYSSRMKPIRVHLVLSVTLKQLAGKMKFKIKSPPTNRYWLGFYEMPKLELVIKPIVSDKQIKLNMVTNAIESKIREVLAETMVLPNMDDFTFCDTDGKGGIFGDRVPRRDEDALAAEAALDTKSEIPAPASKPASVKSTPPPAKPVRRSGSDEHMETNHHLAQPIRTEVSKSSPDLLSARSHPVIDEDALQTRETESAASAEAVGGHSSDSSSNQSIPSSSQSQSSARWASLAMRRKKARSSVDGESISEREDEDSSKPSTDAANSTARSIGSRKGFFSKLGDDAKRGSLYQKAETFWQRGKEMTRELRDKDDTPGRRRLSVPRRFSQSSASIESREQPKEQEQQEEEEKQVTEALVAPEKDTKPIDKIVASDKRTAEPMTEPKAEPKAETREEPRADETQASEAPTAAAATPPLPPLPPRTRAGSTASTASDTERISKNRPLPPPPPPPSALPSAPVPPPRKADTKPPLPPRSIREDESQENKPPVPPRPSNTSQDARPLESAEC